MTQTSEDSEYPTEWQVLEWLGTMWRKLSEDTYQLQTDYFRVTLDQEGFDAFFAPDMKTWNRYVATHNIKKEPLRPEHG